MLYNAESGRIRANVSVLALAAATAALRAHQSAALAIPNPRWGTRRFRRMRPVLRAADDGYDPNAWLDTGSESSLGDSSWESDIASREDGSMWSSFDSGDDAGADAGAGADEGSEQGGEESLLDALQGIAADEVNFMVTEAERADKARQMQELGFSPESISGLLGIATDDGLEADGENEALEAFQEETAETGFGLMGYDDEDLETVESHLHVEWDDAADEPVRAQHVYVDEVSCVGCTLCAGVAQSTFFMEFEQGRARVFQQWGDDDETIEIAIDTCPVNCIHYVPYDELKRLELERRGQNINAAAMEGVGPSYGGGLAFTGHQQISGNMGMCCNNCPSKGCPECPMFGVGLNPAFQRREEARKQKKVDAEMKRAMESQSKRADL